MVWLIPGCESAFWSLILVGLSVRYLAGHRSLELALLAAAPVIDLVLLIASAVSARRGTPVVSGPRWRRSTSASPWPVKGCASAGLTSASPIWSVGERRGSRQSARIHGELLA